MAHRDFIGRDGGLAPLLFLGLTLLVLALVPPAAAAPGDLDTSFGAGGTFSFPAGPHASGINAAVKQPDGKIVVAGFAEESATAPYYGDFMVARLNPNGTLDTSFNAGGAQPGVRTTNITPGGGDFAYNLALGPGGTIYAAGETDPPGGGSSTDFAVVRYTSAGIEDTGFSGDGVQVLARSASFDSANAVAVQADGKPIVAGSGDNGFEVVRLDPTTGALDTSYNGTGFQQIPFGGAFADVPLEIALQGDGKAVLAGVADANSSGADLALVRLNVDGTLDMAGFGAGTGKVQTALPNAQAARAMTLDGAKIVVAGEELNTSGGPSQKDFIVARYLGDGSPDTSFSTDGVVTTPFTATDGTRFSNANGVLVEEGKIIATGTAFNCPGVGCADFAAARYNDDGSLDTTFGDGGKRTYAVGSENDFANAAVAGSAVIVGMCDVGGVARSCSAKTLTKNVPVPVPNRADFEVVSVQGPFGWRASGDLDSMANGIPDTTSSFPLREHTRDAKPQDSFAGWEHFHFWVAVENNGPKAGTCSLAATPQAPDLVQELDFLRVGPETALLGGFVVSRTSDCGEVAAGERRGFFVSSRTAGNRAGSAAIEFRVTNQSPGDTVTTNDAKVSEPVVTYGLGRDAFTEWLEINKKGGKGVAGGGSKRVSAAAFDPALGRLARVDVAILRRRGKVKPAATPKCTWVKSKRGNFKRVAATRGRCSKPVWFRAKGKRRWSYTLRRPLPKGRYVAYVRGVTKAGTFEFRFSSRRGNKRAFRVR